MKTTRSLALLAGGMLALTACGSEEPETSYSDQIATEHFQYGMTSVYRDPDTGAEIGMITVQSIDANYDCDGQPALAAQVEVGTSNSHTDEAFTVDPQRFVFISEDGDMVEGTPVEGCSETASIDVRSGGEAQELMVFDVDMDTGVMALNTHESDVYWEF